MLSSCVREGRWVEERRWLRLLRQQRLEQHALQSLQRLVACCERRYERRRRLLGVERKAVERRRMQRLHCCWRHSASRGCLHHYSHCLYDAWQWCECERSMERL